MPSRWWTAWRAGARRWSQEAIDSRRFSREKTSPDEVDGSIAERLALARGALEWVLFHASEGGGGRTQPAQRRRGEGVSKHAGALHRPCRGLRPVQHAAICRDHLPELAVSRVESPPVGDLPGATTRARREKAGGGAFGLRIVPRVLLRGASHQLPVRRFRSARQHL